jgi:hypothetical protein
MGLGAELSVGVPTVRATHGREKNDMLIDCDTCTARGTGCADCVVTVLLGAPPSWQTSDPVVVPLPDRTAAAPAMAAEHMAADYMAAEERAAEDVVVPPPGLVPPLRHQAGDSGRRGSGSDGRRRTG